LCSGITASTRTCVGGSSRDFEQAATSTSKKSLTRSVGGSGRQATT